MTRPARIALAIVLAFGGSAAAAQNQAQEPVLTYEQTERRARACLTAGAAGAPRTSLEDAVRALAALCSPQLEALRELRVQRATLGLSPEAAETEARSISRALDDEIVLAVANFTGLGN